MESEENRDKTVCRWIKFQILVKKPIRKYQLKRIERLILRKLREKFKKTEEKLQNVQLIDLKVKKIRITVCERNWYWGF